jgi:hypothetical protein
MSIHGSPQTSHWGFPEELSCHSGGQLTRLEGGFLDTGIPFAETDRKTDMGSSSMNVRLRSIASSPSQLSSWLYLCQGVGMCESAGELEVSCVSLRKIIKSPLKHEHRLSQ